MKITSKIKIYLPFSFSVLKSDYLAYKGRFLLWVFANLAIFLSEIFLWIAIFNSSSVSVMKGFTKESIISYIAVSKIFESFSFCSIETFVSQDIRNGNITISLIKPINYKIELLFRTFGQILGSFMFFLPCYLATYAIFIFLGQASFNFTLINIFYFIIFTIIAFTINYFFSLLLSGFVFRTIKSGGIYEIKKIFISILSGSFIPISFYPDILRKSLIYTPFVYLRFIPIRIIQGSYSNLDIIIHILIAIGWIFILGFISNAIWNNQLKKIIVFGG